eukprot:CAMPEP_0174736362 /NCGR_PEP_ID=MMETSP1094-20130205/66548_1 /TAXON_ID=156173 /ORGANISM="Chrysochromulina brevifilum, Strain UTEX LB 985" /LENGTH=120 /DNA_ID=CAMNT_0015939443 /DNA_START=41 /DNA_END=399 /DNA_ORIENTATION=+
MPYSLLSDAHPNKNAISDGQSDFALVRSGVCCASRIGCHLLMCRGSEVGCIYQNERRQRGGALRWPCRLHATWQGDEPAQTLGGDDGTLWWWGATRSAAVAHHGLRPSSHIYVASHLHDP